MMGSNGIPKSHILDEKSKQSVCKQLVQEIINKKEYIKYRYLFEKKLEQEKDKACELRTFFTKKTKQIIIDEYKARN